MATKAKVVLQRVEVKDYQDIAAMLKAGVDLQLGLSIAKKMFEPTFEPQQSLQAMVYFKGSDLDILSQMEKDQIKASVRDVYDKSKLIAVKLASDLMAQEYPKPPQLETKNTDLPILIPTNSNGVLLTSSPSFTEGRQWHSFKPKTIRPFISLHNSLINIGLIHKPS